MTEPSGLQVVGWGRKPLPDEAEIHAEALAEAREILEIAERLDNG